MAPTLPIHIITIDENADASRALAMLAGGDSPQMEIRSQRRLYVFVMVLEIVNSASGVHSSANAVR
jgi:hypothetical protein